jgi:Leucine-rich repeat (LRR) protein
MKKNEINRLQYINILYHIMMNLDTILYTSQFLPSLKDKMTVARTCRDVYDHSNHLYKDVLVQVDETNLEWVKKYKPKLKITDIRYAHLDNVCELDLHGSGLTTWPECILNMTTSLQVLNLSDGYLTQIPESIGQLKQLRIINVAKTGIKTLPTAICELSNLEELRINGNRIETLPESIGLLKQLRVIDVARTSITSLPDSICELSNLEELRINGNRIAALPESIGLLKQLRIINMRSNCISRLPDSIGELSNLKELICTANRLTTLPSSLLNLQHHLKLLMIAFNNFHSLPDMWFTAFPTLHEYI